MIQYRSQLPGLMRELKLPMIATELGSAEGYSAYDFMQGGLDKLYMVDNWNYIPNQKGDGNNPHEWHDSNLKAAQERLKPYGDKVVFLRGMTSEMAWMIPDNICGMIYIDADHSYEAVSNDILNYWHKLVEGGIMAFHDMENDYGVKQAVIEFAERNELTVYLIPENKPEDAGAFLIKS